MRVKALLAAGFCVLVGACGDDGPSTDDSSGGSGTGTGTGSGTGTGTGTGVGSACGDPTACAHGAMCDEDLGHCVCVPGFEGDGDTCTAPARTPLDERTEEEVCAQWALGHQVNAAQPYEPGDGGQCDPGRLPSAALADGMRRWNMYRWLAGLLPAAVDPGVAEAQQACSLMQTIAFGHSFPTDTACYTDAANEAAGASMIALGFGSAADTFEGYMFEPISTNMAHRKICLGVSRDNVNLGFYNSGSCARYAGGDADPSPPAILAVPNPGITPLGMTQSVWSLHQVGDPLPLGDVVLSNEATSEVLPTVQHHVYEGMNTWTLDGWFPEAGTTYRVTLSDGAATLTYTVTPVSCN